MFLEVGETDRPRFSLVYSAILGAVSILALPPFVLVLSPRSLFHITSLQPHKHTEQFG